tara:strand:+ start:3269 stop:3901 length:633 start_codon:yes stop_codon:yes gene_type:complete
MKFLGFNKVLCLAPHPDDIEYSMGGTIIKHYDTHFDILCLTQGGDCDETTSFNRLDEVCDSWKSTNITNVDLYFSPNKFLKEKGEDEWVNYIETNFVNKNNYDGIFIPSSKDSHFEHKIVSNLGWPLTRIKSISLIEYYSPSTLETWIPNTFVDISKFYKTKLKMLKEFTSQQHRSYFKENTIKGFHTNFQCSKKGIELVEQFNLKQSFI